MVHRDIKPENILLDQKGRVKIADFGLAKIMGQSPRNLTLTQDGHVMGTPHYMAPERVEHPRDVDHRADIYSLGVVFYEMLTGELPLGKFAPPSRVVQVDVRLDEVVLKTLEKKPELRYQQVSQVGSEVQTILSTNASPHISVDMTDEAIGKALAQTEQRLSACRDWKGAGRIAGWTTAIHGLVFIFVGILFTRTVSSYAVLFAMVSTPLPALTRMILRASDLIQQYGIFILSLLLLVDGVILCLLSAYGDKRTRRWWTLAVVCALIVGVGLMAVGIRLPMQNFPSSVR